MQLPGAMPHAHYVVPPPPLRGVKVLHSTLYDLTPPASRLPPKHIKREKKRHPGGLAHVVRGCGRLGVLDVHA